MSTSRPRSRRLLPVATVAAAASLAFAPSALAGGPTPVPCKGNSKGCSVKIAAVSGSSGSYAIQLSDTDFAQPRIIVRGSARVVKRGFSLGGSVYTVRVSNSGSRLSTVTLRFRTVPFTG